ncbi:hypothetical protein HMPREF0972_01838 [Actinomyces sp. oral taxon 848 str. F0332]|nr:hypothetical protein HMPREF0972_01838 [Actinomyces sp. oral taxon 848 str. F0332]
MLAVCFRCLRSNFYHKHTRTKKLCNPRKARVSTTFNELESCK